MIRHHRCGFKKGKPCLANLIAFYDEKTVLVDEGRAGNAAYLKYRRCLSSCYYRQTDEYGVDKWAVRWIEIWLNCQIWYDEQQDVQLEATHYYCTSEVDTVTKTA